MARHQHHRHPQRETEQVQHYNDLSPEDIHLLTAILTQPPATSTLSRQTYLDQTRTSIAALPSHLRTKTKTWLSPLCSLHNKLNPKPLTTLLAAIKDELARLSTVWHEARTQNLLSPREHGILLVAEDVMALWLRPEDFETHLGRPATARAGFEGQGSKCAACVLARMGGDVDVVRALGAVLVGRIRMGMWKRSRRILWMESWVRAAVEGGDEEVRRMWELGMDLREVRKEAERGDRERGFVDEFVEEVRERQREGSERSQGAESRVRGVEVVDGEAEGYDVVSRVTGWLSEVHVGGDGEDDR